jgi:hypothetical protein
MICFMAGLRVLFLDDMDERQKTFASVLDGWRDDVEVYRARTAKEATDLLNYVEFDEAYLDHDLSEEDIMCDPDGPTKVPSGMCVVDHIVRMVKPPPKVYVHTCNPNAGKLMAERLSSCPTQIKVMVVPFPQLIQFMRIGRAREGS